MLTLSGSTSDATRYMELTTAAGQSFKDAAGVRTNALKYNQANGVGVRSGSGNYSNIINDTNGFFRCSNIQFKGDGAIATILQFKDGGGICKDCNLTINAASLAGVSRCSTLINVLVFTTVSSSSQPPFHECGIQTGAGLVVGCTAIRTSDQSAAGTAFTPAAISTVQMTDCASFGYTTPSSGSWGTSSNNASDQASGLPGTSNQYNVTFNSTTPFTNSTVASQNSIPVVGTALAANGVLDATNAPRDISGYTRAASPTIGCWELTAATVTQKLSHFLTMFPV